MNKWLLGNVFLAHYPMNQNTDEVCTKNLHANQPTKNNQSLNSDLTRTFQVGVQNSQASMTTKQATVHYVQNVQIKSVANKALTVPPQGTSLCSDKEGLDSSTQVAACISVYAVSSKNIHRLYWLSLSTKELSWASLSIHRAITDEFVLEHSIYLRIQIKRRGIAFVFVSAVFRYFL